MMATLEQKVESIFLERVKAEFDPTWAQFVGALNGLPDERKNRILAAVKDQEWSVIALIVEKMVDQYLILKARDQATAFLDKECFSAADLTMILE